MPYASLSKALFALTACATPALRAQEPPAVAWTDVSTWRLEGRAFDDRDRGSSNAQSAQRDIRDSDGTIRTVEELRYGICRNQRPLLVSAGPDARFGNLLADPSDQDFADAQANTYPYEPDQP